MTLIQAMQTNLPSTHIDGSLRVAVAQMEREKCLVMPILDDEGHLVGALSVQDLAYRMRSDPEVPEPTVRAVARFDPVRCGPEASLERVRELLCASRQPAALVTEPNGTVLGTIDVFQLMEALSPPQAAAGPEPDYVRRVRGNA